MSASQPVPAPESRSFYDEVGGADTFARLTHTFYSEVAKDEILRPLYPEEDLGPAERRLRMFLEQYWGGPRTYSEERGHPRLRMRHHPTRSGRSNAMPGCAACTPRSRRSTHRPSTTNIAARSPITWKWLHSRW